MLSCQYVTHDVFFVAKGYVTYDVDRVEKEQYGAKVPT